ncbi:hypothetical protein HPB49_025970 [Dermacentor silvarum]|nr:hypothetical protein HPB49_025970 [Dermacentor silvarum]
MTDNSRPEKDALKKTWPTAEQLLCQFHVLQAEWRWLTATANKVPKEDRRQLMAAFQKILYAKDLSQLQAAKEHLRTVGHEGYIRRVEAFLCCEKEWVQMYRTNLATRGHNTNNYSEASIRILKDVVLCRTKAFNAVALVEIVVSTWEKYFETRLLRHAHHREASHRLTFEHLLQDLPKLPAGSIRKSGETYYVPSSSSTVTHEVQADVGICSCWDPEEMYSALEKALRKMHKLAEGNAAYTVLLRSFTDGIGKVSSSSGAYSMLLRLNAAARAERRHGKKIRVQPTALARRRPGVTRKSTRIPPGRPAKAGNARKSKRGHKLSDSVRANVPAAKSH